VSVFTNNRLSRVAGLCWLASVLNLNGLSAAEPVSPACETGQQLTFSWQFINNCSLEIRGGTSVGAGLALDTEPSAAWHALAGGYRVSFDFLETVGYTPGFEPDPPYRSWGTEYVYVVEDRGDFISLQHIMVMQYVGPDGVVSEPMVQKHWRQDWQYEEDAILVFQGKDQFGHQQFTTQESQGRWAQSVYQVDDSPRYAAIGQWQHLGNVSSWLSDTTWRPLPRRESSYRQDYDVLVGSNRHTITPTGLVQEEENLKLVLEAPGMPGGNMPYLSKEIGVARYERVRDFDFSAGDQYWQDTFAFWQDVRGAWQEIIAQNRPFVLNENAGGVPLFMAMFMMADEAATEGAYDSDKTLPAIRSKLEEYVQFR
jgi:hypothetical protein